MSEINPTNVLRSGLLEGVAVLLGCAGRERGGGRAELTAAVANTCAELGAVVRECELVSSGAPEADDERVQGAVKSALSELGGVHVLVVDASGLFAADGMSGTAALLDALEATWRLTRALANVAFIEQGVGGRIVYLAPSAADPARAGLENLARTLSIEWARYGITLVAIAPEEGTEREQIAGVVAYLASPAGAYFSGCQLELGRAPGRADDADRRRAPG
jgi:NAD(P)-dependent dehydrogenase (short-subunit alcohol dehydrogenase family)